MHLYRSPILRCEWPTPDSSGFRPKAHAEIGITGVDAALAATGSLVLMSAPGKARSTSLLPATHIAIVHTKQIVADLGNMVCATTRRCTDDVSRCKQCHHHFRAEQNWPISAWNWSWGARPAHTAHYLVCISQERFSLMPFTNFQSALILPLVTALPPLGHLLENRRFNYRQRGRNTV